MIDWVHASVTVIESVTYFFRRKLSLGLFVTIHFNGIQETGTEFIHFIQLLAFFLQSVGFTFSILLSNSLQLNMMQMCEFNAFTAAVVLLEISINTTLNGRTLRLIRFPIYYMLVLTGNPTRDQLLRRKSQHKPTMSSCSFTECLY